MKIFVKTYGCQMNERDSEMMLAQLQRAGHTIATNEKSADVVILNTCSVREQAEIKAIGKAGYLTRMKRTNPNFIIGIVGCMAENLGESIFQRNSAIDFVVGPQRLHELVEVIENGGKNLRIGESKSTKSDQDFSYRLKKFNGTAFVSIMEGCNMRCSYCIVPKTRGKERCRPVDEIVSEVEFLAKNCVKEVTLLGQIVNKYIGMETVTGGGKATFVQLLERIHEISGVERIRYMSPHPRYFSDDLISAHRNLPKLCPAIHLPVQSGSNRVLKSMGRTYGREKIFEIVEKLRTAVPEIGISTDIIVGYPGETEEEFLETVSLFDAVRFNMAFIFKYSPRAGTRSAELADDVPEDEKERRNKVLLERVGEVSLLYNQRFVGKITDVLVEGHAKRGKNIMFGWTPNHHKVLFSATENDIGKIIHVKIDGFATTVLLGTIVD
ncbi:MAG: tRNA (N6-isopentenyl adenosine(37)-C2)-methylthiotransferase MiaB [Puniceicoccales bacterium]|nr:tRNA (N6-isopentenyl adenosine(37)-C2)-methylthiotransferase MiaB [Puniceicoccales bacterium]